MDPITTPPAAPASTTPLTAPNGAPVKLEFGAFPPPPQKAAAMEKLAALRNANAKPSPFDAPNPIASPPPANTNGAATTTPEAEPPKVEAPKIEMDAATLKRLTALSKADRENKQKIAQLEGSSKDAATFAEVKKLYSEGKRMEAIAKLAGATDGVAEMEALMADYLNAPTTDAKDEAKDALVAKVDELAAWKADREKQETERATQQRDQAVQAFAFQVLDADATFEICARPENRAEAASAATQLFAALAGDRGLTQVTEEQSRALYRESFALVEKEYEEMGSRYSKRGTPQPLNGQHQPMSRTPPAVTPQTRPTPSIQRSPIATTGTQPKTLDDHKRRALEAMRGLRR